MATIEQFIAYIGGDADDLTNERLLKCLEVARAMVLNYVKSTCFDLEAANPLATSSIPTSITDVAVIKVADELNNQRNTKPSVKEQIDYGAGLMSNTTRDPMLAVYPLLRGYVSPW